MRIRIGPTSNSESRLFEAWNDNAANAICPRKWAGSFQSHMRAFWYPSWIYSSLFSTKLESGIELSTSVRIASRMCGGSDVQWLTMWRICVREQLICLSAVAQNPTLNLLEAQKSSAESRRDSQNPGKKRLCPNLLESQPVWMGGIGLEPTTSTMSTHSNQFQNEFDLHWFWWSLGSHSQVFSTPNSRRLLHHIGSALRPNWRCMSPDVSELCPIFDPHDNHVAVVLNLCFDG